MQLTRLFYRFQTECQLHSFALRHIFRSYLLIDLLTMEGIGTEPVLSATDKSPNAFNWALGFLMVGIAWGFTTPFIRRGALHFHPPTHASLERIDPESSKSNWVKYKIMSAVWMAVDLLRTPAYAVPLVINLTGSIWFFLLVGKAGELDPCPISTQTNCFVCSLADNLMWLMPGFVDGRIESDGTDHELFSLLVYRTWRMVGRREGHNKRFDLPYLLAYLMASFQVRRLTRFLPTDTWIGMVFALGGIALCVQSKHG